MKVIHTVAALQAELSALRAEGKSVGLVPTMGALHAGHASLVDRSVKENDVTVVSVFVNPTQFNDKNDLLKYPRTLEADCALLEQHGAAIAFAPSVEEVYPEPDTRQFSYAPLDKAPDARTAHPGPADFADAFRQCGLRQDAHRAGDPAVCGKPHRPGSRPDAGVF